MSYVATAPSGFDRFGLSDRLMSGIRSAGFDTPRPIQAETIPAGLQGRDILGLAQTGTGKTAAFTLPLVERLQKGKSTSPRVLVLAPTRELATQIAEEMRSLSQFTRVKIATVFGGVPMQKQVRALRQRPDIVVGCPGRVLDLKKQRVLRLDAIETLVLDEADHMFDMGFLPDIRKILDSLPKKRQNLLFSATMPREVRHLADDLLKNPHIVELASSSPADTIDHALYPVGEKQKRDLLEHMLRQEECSSAIVFIRTKHRVRRIAEQLSKGGFRAVGLQGNLSQAQRDRAMRGFRAGRYDVLVATDIAARGIDVSGVSHVINYDVPSTPEAYTHRIGRTGRSEREGVACTFVTSGDRNWVRATERMIGQPIETREIDGFALDYNDGGKEKPKPRGKRPFRGKFSSRKSSKKPSRWERKQSRHSGVRIETPGESKAGETPRRRRRTASGDMQTSNGSAKPKRAGGRPGRPARPGGRPGGKPGGKPGRKSGGARRGGPSRSRRSSTA